jgi:hypothetical protein
MGAKRPDAGERRRIEGNLSALPVRSKIKLVSYASLG